jgi:hypothetical protein
MQLTVLSALARRNVDPWEEAALLCRMPVVKARRQLIAMLDALPGQDRLTAQEALASRRTLAEGLLPLLPQRAPLLDFASLQRTQPPPHPARVTELLLVAIYVITMSLGGWWFSRDATRAADAQIVQATAAEQVPPAPPAVQLPRRTAYSRF